MKKLLIAMLLVLPLTANAGLLDSVMTSNFPTKQTTSKYKLDVYGYDVRIYEWQPQENKNIRCVFIAGNKNSSGVSCYKIK